MIQIPDEHRATLLFCVKTTCLSMEYFLKLDDYQRLEFLSKLQGFEHIAEMLQSKKFEDIIEDMEIKDMVRGAELDYKRNHEELEALLTVIENQD